MPDMKDPIDSWDGDLPGGKEMFVLSVPTRVFENESETRLLQATVMKYMEDFMKKEGAREGKNEGDEKSEKPGAQEEDQAAAGGSPNVAVTADVAETMLLMMSSMPMEEGEGKRICTKLMRALESLPSCFPQVGSSAQGAVIRNGGASILSYFPGVCSDVLEKSFPFGPQDSLKLVLKGVRNMLAKAEQLSAESMPGRDPSLQSSQAPRPVKF